MNGARRLTTRPQAKSGVRGTVFSLADRVLDAIFGGAYRKFGPKRYELRLTVRNLLMEALRQIDPKKHLRSKEISLTLDGLQNWIDLLPTKDTVKVLSALQAVRSLEGGPPSFYEDQAEQNAWKATCVAARIPISEANDYLNRKLKV